MTAANFDISSLKREERRLAFAGKIYSLLNIDIVGFLSLVYWLVVLLLLIPLGLLFTFLLYIPLVFARRNLTKSAKILLENLESIPARDAMVAHAAIEQYLEVLNDAIKKGEQFFVLKPLNSELAKISVAFHETELGLRNYVYPDLDRGLTNEQLESIKGVMKEWEEDWADSELDLHYK